MCSCSSVDPIPGTRGATYGSGYCFCIFRRNSSTISLSACAVVLQRQGSNFGSDKDVLTCSDDVVRVISEWDDAKMLASQSLLSSWNVIFFNRLSWNNKIALQNANMYDKIRMFNRFLLFFSCFSYCIFGWNCQFYIYEIIFAQFRKYFSQRIIFKYCLIMKLIILLFFIFNCLSVSKCWNLNLCHFCFIFINTVNKLK